MYQDVIGRSGNRTPMCVRTLECAMRIETFVCQDVRECNENGAALSVKTLEGAMRTEPFVCQNFRGRSENGTPLCVRTLDSEWEKTEFNTHTIKGTRRFLYAPPPPPLLPQRFHTDEAPEVDQKEHDVLWCSPTCCHMAAGDVTKVSTRKVTSSCNLSRVTPLY